LERGGDPAWRRQKIGFLGFLCCPKLFVSKLPPIVVWALSIVEVFFSALALSVGCDPSQCYFSKMLLGSKGDYKGYILAS
jgi:hypothetical protein